MADTALPGHIPGARISLDQAKAPGFLDAKILIAHAPDPMFVSDLEGTILHANDAATRVLGIRPADTLEQLRSPFLNEEEAQAFCATMGEVVERDVTRRIPIQTRSASGEVIPNMLNVSALRDSDGRIMGTVGILHDMRACARMDCDQGQAQVESQEVRQLRQQVQEQRQALEALNAQTEQMVQERTRALVETIQAKDEFLSIASHELKTPLTTIKLLTQLAQRELVRANAPQVIHTERMGRAITRMEQLINDLLDVSRIDSGNLMIRPELCNLAALCKQVAEEQAAASNRTVTFVEQGTPIEMLVDGERIGQVVTNLLSNALRYSPTDAPVLVTFVQEEGAGIICVRDRGPGIPADALPQIFDRFYRVPGIEAQNGTGSGLGVGLYLCREIVERHGGQIWAESTPGSGSNFYVALPVAGSFGQEESLSC